MSQSSSNMCQLCKTKLATQKKSHIVPKFLGKELYANLPHRHTVAWINGQKDEKWQDIPKQDFLFCPSCETRIGRIENYMKRRLDEIHNFQLYPTKFEFNNLNDLLTCVEISSNLFKLFILSIVWRCSISTLPAFKNFNIGTKTEGEIQRVLDKYLKLDQSELINQPFDFGVVEYDIVVFKCKEKQSPPGGFLTAYSKSIESHLILLVEFIVFFVTDPNQIAPKLLAYSNKYKEHFVLGLFSEGAWRSFHAWMALEMKSANSDKRNT